ncbi:hypothetical protein C8R44DRAFT_741902 [Mycena epipterygia]|nr:hypothetical protein C8R44DRAFT_741902 [Mycena epipterygia]
MFNKVFFSAILAVLFLGQGVVSQNLGSVCGGATVPSAALPAPSKSASPPSPTARLCVRSKPTMREFPYELINGRERVLYQDTVLNVIFEEECFNDLPLPRSVNTGRETGY